MLSLVVWWNKTKWKFCDKERNSKVSREYSIYYHENFSDHGCLEKYSFTKLNMFNANSQSNFSQ